MFEYDALDREGRTRRGVAEGDSVEQVRQALRDRALLPLSLRAVTTPAEGGQRGLHGAELTLLTRQLASLLAARLPLDQALATMARQARKPRVRRVVLAVRERVRDGMTLAGSLRAEPRAFPEVFWASVAAGEASGRLDIVLSRLADLSEREQALARRFLLALLYPAIVFVAGVLIVSGLVVFVLPEMLAMLADAGRSPPLATRVVLSAGRFLEQWGGGVLAGIGIAALGARLGMRLPSVRLAYHRLLLRIPVVSGLLCELNTARFSRTLGTLYASGVRGVEALRVAAPVVTLAPMREAIEDVIARVSEGTSLAAALGRCPYFSPVTLELIGSGDSGAELEPLLAHAARDEEQAVETRLLTLLALVEPALILVMGGLVVLAVFAILGPVLELNALVPGVR